MNFLAHFHLAWPDEGLIAGGLEGDFYKGPLRDDLPEAVARGVQLHRAIDAYTDQHPALKELRAELPPHLRRFAGIVIDLSFDHFLSGTDRDKKVSRTTQAGGGIARERFVPSKGIAK